MPGDENSQNPTSSTSDQTDQENNDSQSVDGEVSPNSGAQGSSATMTDVAEAIAAQDNTSGQDN